jgi:ABC-type dipeptide/oligopeptide/nickel transport system permease subunit
MSGPEAAGAGESLSQWQLIRRRFSRHRLAVASLYLLLVLYFLALFAEFFSPYTPAWRDLGHAYCPPQLPRFSFRDGFHVRSVERTIDPVTYRRTYVERADDVTPLGFFVEGEPYRLWGLIPCRRHFFGVKPGALRPRLPFAGELSGPPPGAGPEVLGLLRVDREDGGFEEHRLLAEGKTAEAIQSLLLRQVLRAAAEGEATGTGLRVSRIEEHRIPTFYLLGADMYGQDLLSRILHGARISLSVGLVGIALAFLLGVSIGGISGYVGGRLDVFIQRCIEVINSLPHLPLWLALAAAMPPEWSPLQIYFAITIVLAFLGWTGLARVVRGKFLSLREEDFAVAARLMGASHKRIIFIHLLPGFTSHIIVSLTLAVPGMILGETSLSFLGLGLRPPVVSWGVMLRDCMYLDIVANYPWLYMPVFFIVGTVLCFNFLGDGLRDAADPYSAR